MKIKSYIIKHDHGFAPNPYCGFLTLATCKPRIRNSANIKDIIVATGSITRGYKNKLIYAAQVSQVIDMNKYFEDPVYQVKKPSCENDIRDNIYYRENGNWKQLNNRFHTKDDMKRDLSSTKVLVCKDFWYFGREAPLLPENFFEIVKKGPGHKNIDNINVISGFLDWLSTYGKGINGEPIDSIKKMGRYACENRKTCCV